MSVDAVFTIVSRNYAAQAACLMQSLARVEPDLARIVVVCDGPLTLADEAIEVIEAETLVPDFPLQCAYYDALELNTAVKPHAFRALLKRFATLTYLDPDIWVYQPLDLVRQALKRAPLALTPHLTRPLSGPANPNDHTILTSGSFNLGFMSVRNEPQIEALLDWWAEKCRFDCRVDFANGLFTDQKWMDLAPGLVSDLAILRDPGLNLAYWNLQGRDLTQTPAGWQVDGQPLVFFHFSGFDPRRPAHLSKHQDRNEVAQGSPLSTLLKDYGAQLLAHGHIASSAVAYGHDHLPSGRAVTRPERRRMLDAARRGLAFGGGLTEAAETWLSAPEPLAGRRAVETIEGPWTEGSEAITRWFLADPARPLAAMLAGRADLRARFAPDDPNLPAVLVSEEALAGRFAAPLLGLLGSDLIERVKVLADLDAIQLYGLSHRAGWSLNQRASVCADLDRPGFGPAFPQLFIAIWNGRPDLQRLFDLARSGDRFRFLRWLIGGGLAEYGLELAALPVVVTRSLTFRLAGLSLNQRSPQPPRRTGPAVPSLVVRESGPAETLTYEASTGRFLQASGLPATPPLQVARVAFETEPGLHPLDAIAMMARGVCWTA
jgi:hypothetical protein